MNGLNEGAKTMRQSFHTAWAGGGGLPPICALTTSTEIIASKWSSPNTGC